MRGQNTIRVATLVSIDEGYMGIKREGIYKKHMKGLGECSLRATSRTNGLVIDTHSEGWMVLHICHNWIGCHQDELLLESQPVEPVAVHV